MCQSVVILVGLVWMLLYFCMDNHKIEKFPIFLLQKNSKKYQIDKNLSLILLYFIQIWFVFVKRSYF